MTKRKRIWLLGILIGIPLLAGLGWLAGRRFDLIPVSLPAVLSKTQIAALPTRLAEVPKQVEIALQKTPTVAPLAASGIIEADEVSISGEYGGRIAEITVVEGDEVAAGQVLVRLDTALLDAQIEAANAAVEVAQAALAQARAGARPGQVAVAEAQLAQAQTELITAGQAVTDTAALVADPQEVDLNIAVTEAQIEAAKHEVARASALEEDARISKERAERYIDKEIKARVPVGISPSGKVIFKSMTFDAPYQVYMAYIPWWKAWVGINSATAQQGGLEASLDQLYVRRDDPHALVAQADEALGARAQAEAQVALAHAQVSALKAGDSSEQLAALEARVVQAQAAVDALARQRAKLEVSTAVSGTVMNVYAHPGEVAAPGAALLSIADLTDTYLTVYMPETQMGRIHLGQNARVTVDSFPGRTFAGSVERIADQAEFTPRNVATAEERVNLVFAVRIRLASNEQRLKPGMPADVVLEE